MFVIQIVIHPTECCSAEPGPKHPRAAVVMLLIKSYSILLFRFCRSRRCSCSLSLPQGKECATHQNASHPSASPLGPRNGSSRNEVAVLYPLENPSLSSPRKKWKNKRRRSK